MHQNRSHHHHGTAEGSFTAKKWFGHRAGRSPCAHSIGKFFLCYIVLFSSETSAPGSPSSSIICYLDIYVDVCLPTCTPIHQTSSKICSPSIRSYPSGMGAVQAKQPEGQSCQGSMPQSVRGIVEKCYQGNPVPSCFGPDIHLINLDILILQFFKMF